MNYNPQHRPDLAATQPYQPPPASPVPPGPGGRPQAPRLVRRRRGPAFWAGAAVVGLLAMMFLCGAMLAVYIIFPPAPTDILVMGLDARPGEGVVTRTDSVMIVGVDPSRLRISMLSIPRDIFINVPYYGSQRINTVNMLGEMESPGTGPQLLSDAIENSFGIQPDRYMRLSFDAFVEMVDAVGGVSIYVERTITDNTFPTMDGGTMAVQFESGQQTMNGERALIYARTRHADDDYGRAGRQQQVVSALARRLINPLSWPAALSVLNRNIETNLTLLDMAGMLPAVVLTAGNFDRLVIDRDYILPGSNGAVPNYEALEPWISARFN